MKRTDETEFGGRPGLITDPENPSESEQHSLNLRENWNGWESHRRVKGGLKPENYIEDKTIPEG